jgi:amino-acid N-acetyltransferase
MNITQALLYKQDVISLLSASNLPVNDLPHNLENFYVFIDEDNVAGVAGLEIHGNYGLLRSLAVAPSEQGKGIAAKLLTRIEELAITDGLEGMYLLTETAEDYFDKHGYEHIARMDVPEEIKRSVQFTQTCPESAIAMKKFLGD